MSVGAQEILQINKNYVTNFLPSYFANFIAFYIIDE